MCPSSDFKWKTKFTIVILTKNGFQKFHTFYSKLLSKIWIFIWNLLRGTWKGFSFDVYMPSITIFIKIMQPFAWHISFLVRHLRRYSVLWIIYKSVFGSLVTCKYFQSISLERPESFLSLVHIGTCFINEISSGWVGHQNGNWVFRYIIIF